MTLFPSHVFRTVRCMLCLAKHTHQVYIRKDDFRCSLHIPLHAICTKSAIQVKIFNALRDSQTPVFHLTENHGWRLYPTTTNNQSFDRDKTLLRTINGKLDWLNDTGPAQLHLSSEGVRSYACNYWPVLRFTSSPNPLMLCAGRSVTEVTVVCHVRHPAHVATVPRALPSLRHVQVPPPTRLARHKKSTSII